MQKVKSIEDQKNRFENQVLDLIKKVEALKFILEKGRKQDDPAVKLAVATFNDFLIFVHKLLWENVVVDLAWLFNEKEQRGIHWYLKNLNVEDEDLLRQFMSRIESLDDVVQKIRRIRNQWVAHKDPRPFSNPSSFWGTIELKISEVEDLTSIASDIIQSQSEVYDLSTTGIHKLFALPALILQKNPEFVNTMKDYRVSD